MRAIGLVLALGACDPIWGASVALRDPSDHPIENATLAVACPDGDWYQGSGLAVRSQRDGTASVVRIGNRFPPSCDIYIAKPGFQTHRITYRELCPDGGEHCDRVFHFDLVLEPE